MKIERILKGICVIALIVIAVSTAIIALDTLNLLPEEKEEKKVTYTNNIDKTPKEGEKVNFKSLVAPPDFVLENMYEVYQRDDMDKDGIPDSKDKAVEYPSLLESIFT